MTPPCRVPSHRAQRGAVAASFIVMAVLLLGFVALAMDAGRIYVSKTELQNATDACALAASRALTGANANQLTMAEDFGMATGNRNKIGMQSTALQIARSDITFSATLNGTYRTSDSIGNPLDMRYVRCSLSEAGIGTILLKILNAIPGQNIGNSTVAATAVASLRPSISNCALPMAACEPNLPQVGQWMHGIVMQQDPHSPDLEQQLNGSFRWIKYTGDTQLKDLAQRMAGAGQCDLADTSTVDSSPGGNTSLYEAYNTRFGIYKKNYQNNDNTWGPANAPPDWTGWIYSPALGNAANNPYWPPSNHDAMPDFLNRRGQSAPKHPDAGTNPPFNLDNKYSWAETSNARNEYEDYGQDRRLVVLPVVEDCNQLGNNGQNVPVKFWGCFLMLNPVFPNNKNNDYMYLEYRGNASDISSGCVTSGAPGGPGAGGPKVPTLVQ